MKQPQKKKRVRKEIRAKLVPQKTNAADKWTLKKIHAQKTFPPTNPHPHHHPFHAWVWLTTNAQRVLSVLSDGLLHYNSD